MTTAGVHQLHRDDPEDGQVELIDDTLVIHELVVDEPEPVRLAATATPAELPDLIRRMLSVGARGLTTMGIGTDLADVDTRVAAVVARATDEAERIMAEILENGRRALGEQFDPEQRSSVLARALGEFSSWRENLLRDLDPAVEDSTATALVARLRELVGPDGALEQRLTDAFDLDSDGSALGRLAATIRAGFDDVRRDLARTQGADAARAAEAERGTAHGREYEDAVESHLRSWASHLKGTVVERTSATTGSLSAASRVGDFVVTIPSGRRIVVEAKRHASITLTGSDGILGELDRAMANRGADAAVCIAGRDAFPSEVGSFNVYGDRVLAVDEGDGTMIAVAMQWAAAALSPARAESGDIDGAAVNDRIDRIRKAAERLSGARRAVTNIWGSLDKLHDTLGELRSEMLDHVGDLDRLLGEAESLGTRDPRP